MDDLKDLIWAEKYRPQKFEDLILEQKDLLLNFLENKNQLPSFIFYSSKPGTGKTSTSKLIIKELDCDSLCINSSDERGIDTIREKINLFARSLSSNSNSKRCVFMDEADGLTRQAQDSLRNLMEEFSENCFFIFTANDVSKIIEPIRSRCQLVCFERPNKSDIFARLSDIIITEKLNVDDDQLNKIIDGFYPDIRKMISHLQMQTKTNSDVIISQDGFNETFLTLIMKQDVKKIYDIVYSGDFDIMIFNKWLFHRLFEKYSEDCFDECLQIALRLADTEKAWNAGANLEVIFITNILDIMKIMKKYK